jgi:hypothetical protein
MVALVGALKQMPSMKKLYIDRNYDKPVRSLLFSPLGNTVRPSQNLAPSRPLAPGLQGNECCNLSSLISGCSDHCHIEHLSICGNSKAALKGDLLPLVFSLVSNKATID